MDADLVLEGGGVKGIALVGALSALAERGWEFRRIAGSSAGAVVGALAAAGMTPARMRELLAETHLPDFADPGLLARFGTPGQWLAVLLDKGIHRGDVLREWVGALLAEYGVETFGDLRIPPDEDPGSPLPAERAYRLVIVAADVSRGRLLRLPWDYADYGLDPDRQPVAHAVRASASIPFFYRPVRLKHRGSGTRSYLVDGGVLSNFPVNIFDRVDGRPPRFPSFGVKLSARPEATHVPHRIRTSLDFGRALVSTVLSAQDQRHLDDPCVVARTIFVDTMKVQSTDFDIDADTRDRLYANGRAATERFLGRWDFEEFLRMCGPAGPAHR